MINNYLETTKKQLKKFGTILIPKKYSFIKSKDFKNIEKNLKKLPSEFVQIGDAGENNHVDVCRLMTDVKGPKVVNKNISKNVLDILNKKYMKYFKFFATKKTLYIRRAQVNVMKKNSFVGYHLDVDSNPDYLYAVVLQLGAKFTGGQYVVYKKGKKPRSFPPKYQSIIISDCKIPHEVLKVKSGKRVSFVFFLSQSNKKNRRYS